jgi:hypothetical protein
VQIAVLPASEALSRVAPAHDNGFGQETSKRNVFLKRWERWPGTLKWVGSCAGFPKILLALTREIG